ncbi:MAG: 3-hydroxyacyl-CoA dehydrogenase family protein [Paludibacter sp.]|jgi:3-hydroxybutyryl-CoA dehydrogenase|nr:3-hydroxyacyl-CoA dehydrogenase family protein [Paludibacter sp.]
MEEITEAIEQYGLNKQNRKRTLFSRIGVVGCGKEGSVIATVAALRGIEVVFLEPDAEKIANSFARIEEKLDLKIANWGMTENEKKTVLGRIQGTSKYDDFATCDFVIEAVRYDESGQREHKRRKEVFSRLESILSPEAIIASNISTVDVTELASELTHKERCIGLHFISHISDSQIIEVVRGLYTSDDTFDKIVHFTKLINYDYVEVLESAGLVSMRMYLTQINEACGILMEGIASIEDIDKVMTIGFGHRQGVFRTADQIGIEKIVKLLENMYDEYGHLKYKPSPILLRLMRAKHHGISTGKGFYDYKIS